MEHHSHREVKAENRLCLAETVNSQSKQKEEKKNVPENHKALQGEVGKD